MNKEKESNQERKDRLGNALIGIAQDCIEQLKDPQTREQGIKGHGLVLDLMRGTDYVLSAHIDSCIHRYRAAYRAIGETK